MLQFCDLPGHPEHDLEGRGALEGNVPLRKSPLLWQLDLLKHSQGRLPPASL